MRRSFRSRRASKFSSVARYVAESLEQRLHFDLVWLELPTTPISEGVAASFFLNDTDFNVGDEGFIDWGDGETDTHTMGAQNTSISHTFANSGEYNVMWTYPEGTGENITEQAWVYVLNIAPFYSVSTQYIETSDEYKVTVGNIQDVPADVPGVQYSFMFGDQANWGNYTSNPVAFFDAALLEQQQMVYVRVKDADGGVRATDINMTLPALSVTAVNSSQLMLTWNDAISGETGWRVQRYTGAESFQTIANLPANTTQFTDSLLPGGTSFFYRVRAVGTAGTSNDTGYSPKVSAITYRNPLGDLAIRDDKTGGGTDAFTVTGVHASLSNITDPEGTTSLRYSFAFNQADLPADYNAANPSVGTSIDLDVTQRGSKTVYAGIYSIYGRAVKTASVNVIDNDPVIVINEAIDDFGTFSSLDRIEPFLWKNPAEFAFDLRDIDKNDPPWNSVDGDGNGFADDAYGWNFAGGHGAVSFQNTPNFVSDVSEDGHGNHVTNKPAEYLASVGADASHVKVMYVLGQITENSPALNYILWHKNNGVNIVAIGEQGPPGNRAAAEALNAAGIMLIGGNSNNANLNQDSNPGDTLNSFYSATPRSGTQLPPLDNVITVTTDPGWQQTSYGVNSYYFAVPGVEEQSYAGPKAAAMVAVAVQKYLEVPAHNFENPSVQQIKQALMTGVTYTSALGKLTTPDGALGRTITHDFDPSPAPGESSWKDGGILNSAKIIAAINAVPPPEVSIAIASQPLTGTTVSFNLNDDSGTVSDWTVSWGDNTVEVLVPGLPSYPHTYPSGVSHKYYPTVYANFGTGTNRKVSFANTIEVVVPPFAPTSGNDVWKLSRENDDITLELHNSFLSGGSSVTFPQGDYEELTIPLGVGDDGLIVDYSGGDPLEDFELHVEGVTGEGNGVTIIGSSMNDEITVGFVSHAAPFIRHLTTQNSSYNSSFSMDMAVAAFNLSGGDGNDTVDTSRVFSNTTLFGDAGNDTLLGGTADDSLTGGAGNDSLDGSEGQDTLDGGNDDDALHGGDDNDTLIGGAGADTLDGGNSSPFTALGDVALYPSATGSFSPAMSFTDDDTANDGAAMEYDNVKTTIEIVKGGEGHDAITAGDAGFRIHGGAGNDTITGSSSGDTLEGGYGADVLYGEGGNDNLFSNGQYDSINEAPPHDDELHGGAGDDQFLADTGNDWVYGEADNDTLGGGAYAAGQHLFGGDGNDSIVGGGGNDFIEGGDGNDTLTGGAGSDIMNGGDGIDLIHAQDGYIDTIDGGADADSVGSSDSNDVLLDI